ncbi:hypothetical protein COG71_24105 [Salmonella enterica]|nr:hypothetical protein [Salmonella enterica]
MTKLTKEQLIEEVKRKIAVAERYPNSDVARIEVEIFKIALASLDADQPVPEEIPKGLAGQIVGLLAHNIGDKLLAQKIWNACRAAMLNGGKS